MQVINHKVYLYKPDGSSSSFLGELIVDNLKVDLKLQDISSISFRIPEVINGEVNPRVDEVLDSYIVELWYGRIDGVYENGDFEKVRFRIYSTPLEFAEYKYLHSYSGYSIESDLEFKQIVSWPGIEVKDFFRTLKYNNNASTPAFTEPGFSYTVLLSTNTSQTKYIKILPTDQPSALDIFIYEKRINTADDSESETSLIELTSGGVNSNDFKAGYYYLTTFNGIVTEIYIAIPDNVTLFNGQNTSTRIFSYRLYDNPVSRKFAVGVKTNTEEPLSNMYIDLAQDAATGDDTPEYGGYTFNTQATYSKNGLKLQEILQGIDNEEDGILYNTGFTLDTISNTINAKYRSNIDFNNITVYQAIKEVAESFDAIAVFNTTNKTVSFYAENEFGTNSGLFIKYATYLKSINKEIDAAKIITNARATGKDNIKISLLNPTGSEVWEDYSYFLDGFLITDTEGFTINQNIDIGLSITYPTTTGLQSRWMDATEALKIAKWQFTRDYFHGVLSDKDADVYGILHEPFRGLYEERSKLINLYVKYETQYERKKASEYKFYYLSEHYKNLYQSRGTNLNEYQYYLAKYNESKQQAQDFKNTVLNVTYNNLYNEQQSGTVAFRLAIVRDYLDKAAWAIDLEKLRTFQRETTHNDSKIDNEYDLLTATKIFVDENKQPRITFNISIIDVLEAAEAYQDWDKFNVGDKIYIFFPEFNIDLEAQIREVSIDFQGKSLSIVVSTVRNYNRSFGNFLTKSIRRFHNANMNTLMYYKDANEVTIEDTNNFRTTFEDGIDAGSTSFSTGAVDDSTGESSTTTDGEGQKSKIVTGVDIYTEALTLSEFTTGVKITDGRVLTFKPYDVGGEQWVQEVEISADNGFVIRQVFSDGPTIDVRRLAYIDSDDGSAYFAGWKLDPGQFKSGAGANFVAINSQPVATNPYAFWSGDLVPSLAPFSIKKDGTIIAEKGIIAGLTIAKDLVNPNLVKFYSGAGNFYNSDTPFYLTNSGNFSLSNKLKFDISTQTLTINGTIVATDGSIGGWTIEENQLSSGLNNTYVALNANSLSDYAFWAGATDPVNAPFSVKKDGTLLANAGLVAGLTMQKVGGITKLYAGTGTWNNNNTAFYLDSTGKFSLEDQISWDPENDTLNIAGGISAQYGEIGGWTVSAKELHAGEDGTYVELNADPLTDYAIFAGSENPAVAPFKVNKDGDLYAANAIISGEVNATSGTFNNTITVGSATDKITIAGASNANDTKIFSGVGTYNNVNTGFYLDAAGRFSLGDQLYWDGAGNLIILGTLEADTGIIGGFQITEDTIQQGATTSKFVIQSDENAPYLAIGQNVKGYNENGIFLGLESDGESTPAYIPKFSIKSGTNSLLFDGLNLSLTGSVTADSGEIGGWTIDSDAIYTGTKTASGSFTDPEDFASITLGSDGHISSKQFRIDTDGTAVFGGSLSAASGSFGYVTIDAEGKIELGNIKINNSGINATVDEEVMFNLNATTGVLTANDVNLSGTITASGGAIGGLIIGADKVYVGDPTFNDADTPFYVDNTGKFSLLDKLSWDLTTLSIKGSLTGSTGIFGGAAGSLYKVYLGDSTTPLEIKNNTTTRMSVASDGAITLGALSIDNLGASSFSGSLAIGSGDTIFKADTNGIYLGNASFASAPFSVTPAGILKATAGTIGGVSIDDDRLYTGDGEFEDAATAFYLDTDGQFSLGTKFVWDGTDLTIDGEINATTGAIGGWNIGADNLNSAGFKLKSSETVPYLSIGQVTEGFNQDGVFLGIDSSEPKFSLKGTTSTLQFNGQALSITGGSLTVGTNGTGTGSVVVDGAGIYGYYNGNTTTPTFKFMNSTGRLEAVDIYLESGNKKAEIGNLTGSLAGDFGFEITNNGGYYLNKTDISFTAATKIISSTTTDLSVYKKGNKIVVTNSLNNNGTFTAAENGTATSLEVEETLVDEVAGTTLTIARSQPYKVSMTDEGFFVLSVDALNTADTAMSVRYDSNRIWAKRLLIADVEDEEGATVVIGTIAGNASLGTNSTYGIITKTGDNIVYMTGEGFKIVQDGQETFKVQANGTVTAETLVIRGDSTLGGWTVSDDYFQSNNYSYTDGDFSDSGIKFNNNGTIIGKQFAIDSTGDAFFRGDLSAATGTFGATNAGHVILGNEDNPLQVKNNTDIILDLEDDGTLKFAGFTADSSSLKAGTVAGNFFGISTGAGTNDDISFWAGATSNTQNNIDAAPFRVKTDGSLVATNADISGTINASEGNFTNIVTVGNGSTSGTIEVGTSALNTDKIIITGTNSAATTAIYSGTGDFGDPTMKFFVNAEGKFSLGDQLTWDPAANSGLGQLIILGDIEADTGTVGGWDVDANSLTSGDFVINSDFENDNLKPYISINQTSKAYNQDGIFLGVHLENLPTPTYSARFSIKNGSNGLFWDGSNLTINGGGTFSGALSAATGSFGNTTINGTSALTIGTYELGTSGDIKITNASGIVARNEDNEPIFTLGTDGNLTLTGTVNATGGNFSNTVTVGLASNKISIKGDLDSEQTKIYAGTGTYANANTGFFMDATGRFSLGNKLTWDGSTLSINGSGTFTGSLAIGTGDAIFKADGNGIYLGDADFADAEFSVTPEGVLKATSGTVGGWTLASTSLTGGDVKLENTGNVTVGTLDDVARLSGSDTTYRLWVGKADAATAPFSVTKAGVISATSGKIANWTLGTNKLTAGSLELDATTGAEKIKVGSTITIDAFNGIKGTDGTNTSFQLKLDGTGLIGGFAYDTNKLTAGGAGTYAGISPSVTTSAISFWAGAATVDNSGIAAAPFRVTNTGILNATGAIISGNITADTGNIGGFTILANSLSAGATGSSVGLSPDYGTSDVSIWAGATRAGAMPTDAELLLAPFYVTKQGYLKASSGKVGGWTLGNTNLTAGADGTSVGVTTDAIAFYAGNATPGSAPFRVENNGALTATSATISGTVNANAGNFTSTVTIGSSTTDGKLKIGRGTDANSIFLDGTNSNTTTAIYSGTTEFGSAVAGFYMDASGRFSLGNKLSWNGTVLTIDGGGSFSGGLVAATGTFGAVSIASGGSLTVGTNITINNTDGIKGTNGTTTAFQLNPNGTGSIGGFSYGLSSITSTNLTLSSGASPYLYFGADATPAYGDVGAFLGIVSSTPKFSLVSGTGGTDGFLKYDPSATYDLEIGGDAKIGPLIANRISDISSPISSGDYTTSGSLSISSNSNPFPPVSGSKTFTFSGGVTNIKSFSLTYTNTYAFSAGMTVTIKFRNGGNGDSFNVFVYSFSPSSGSNIILNRPDLDVSCDRIIIELNKINFAAGSFTASDPVMTKTFESFALDKLKIYTSGLLSADKLQTNKIRMYDDNINSATGTVYVKDSSFEISRTDNDKNYLKFTTALHSKQAGTGFVTSISPDTNLTQNVSITLPNSSGTIALTSFLQTATELGSVSRGATGAMDNTGAAVTITSTASYAYILLRLFVGNEDSNAWILIPESIWDDSTTETHTLIATKDNYQTGLSITIGAVRRVSNTSIRVWFSFSSNADDILRIYGVS
jgi:hypothetical protein